MTVVSAREFNRDVSAAKRAAENGPVMVTDRGRVSHVLLSVEEYDRLRGASGTLVDRLSLDVETDLDPAPLDLRLRVPEL